MEYVTYAQLVEVGRRNGLRRDWPFWANDVCRTCGKSFEPGPSRLVLISETVYHDGCDPPPPPPPPAISPDGRYGLRTATTFVHDSLREPHYREFCSACEGYGPPVLGWRERGYLPVRLIIASYRDAGQVFRPLEPHQTPPMPLEVLGCGRLLERADGRKESMHLFENVVIQCPMCGATYTVAEIDDRQEVPED